MTNMIRVLYVATALDSKNSIAAELTKALSDARGDLQIDLVVPHTDTIDKGVAPLAKRLVHCQAQIDGSARDISVLEGRSDAHVRTFYLDATEIKSGLSLDDDAGIIATAAFAQGVCQWLINAPIEYDIVHCEGLLTAMVPLYLRTICAETPRAAHAKSVVTLNGTENKATVDMAWINRLGLPQNLTSSEGLEFYGKMSILKGAYLYADKLAFPNHIVKNNIEKSVGSDIGMEGVLFSRLGNLETIRLGIDTDKLNPRTDKALDANYDDDDMAGKKTCKNALTKSLSLLKNRPVALFIGALNAESGIDLINDILDDVMAQNVNLVVVGRGDLVYENAVQQWHDDFKSQMTWIKDANCADIRKLLAGADILFVPAKHECGCRLHQIAMHYGCIPVVRALGAMANDIAPVVDIDANINHENGFACANYDSDDFYNIAMDAIDLIQTNKWKTICHNAMTKNLSIAETANDCIKVYDALK